MMRTSFRQYVLMVDYMEKFGDLSKPYGGGGNRTLRHMKWTELSKILNNESLGVSRSVDKWCKVWSDFKNNTRRKSIKLKQRGKIDGFTMQLTDLEKRVIQLMGLSVNRTVVTEAARSQDEEGVPGSTVPQMVEDKILEVLETLENKHELDCSSPGPNILPTVPLSQEEEGEESEEWQQPQKRKKKEYSKLYPECDKQTKLFGKEHVISYQHLEMEKLRQRDEELRLKELELRERIRQRDVELKLQERWLDFMKESMNVFVKLNERPYLNE